MSVRGLLVDPIQYSQSYHHKNYMADGKENYHRDLESERVKIHGTCDISLLLPGPLLSKGSDAIKEEGSCEV